jgi:hypothetical protein
MKVEPMIRTLLFPATLSLGLLAMTLIPGTSPASLMGTNISPASAAASSNDQLRQWPNYAFNVGERLTFDISYGIVTAGQAVMSTPQWKVINGRQTIETRVEAFSSPSFDWVFKVRDRYQTFLDGEGLFPWRFEQHVREGSYSRDYNAVFDPLDQTAVASDGKTYKTEPYVHDIVSAFYYIRTLDLTRMRKGDKIHLQNFFDGKTHPLDVLVLGHQRVETEAGTFNCVVVEPLVVEGGLFKNEGSIRIWMTDDANHMPVKMSTKVIIGSIDAKLVKYQGVKNPLLAKVE